MRILTTTCVVLAILSAGAYAQTNADLKEQVRQSEIAFAKTMADRDHTAFVKFLANDAVFGGGPRSLHGPAAIGEGWKRFYDGAAAPFSWEPEAVEVIESGTLAFSSGPVRDGSGKRTGTFNTVWRREPNGQWKVVFDRGCPACDCGPAK